MSGGMSTLKQTLLISLAVLSTGAASRSQPATPYSLVVGDLVSQKEAPGNPCGPDEDLCFDAMIETGLSDVLVLAGNWVSDTLRFRHRMHAPYRRGATMQLAAVVIPQSGGVRRGILIGRIYHGKVCLDESWFQPNEDGMPIPRGHSVNKDNEVCFFEGRDF